MRLNERYWRPITFQGVTFPPTLMGVSILETVLGITDEELGEWLWRFPICCGITKTAPAERCGRYAQRVIDLMLERRQSVLDGIRDHLVPHGFEAEATYRDWLMALKQIVELAAASDGECSWSAPSHPDDSIQGADDVERFMRNLENQ